MFDNVGVTPTILVSPDTAASPRGPPDRRGLVASLLENGPRCVERPVLKLIFATLIRASEPDAASESLSSSDASSQSCGRS
jgi:hypothetical protein